MRRRRSRKPNVSLSLFPFLAVLVCTMGALIVLLVLVVQQARVSATVARTSAPAEDERELDNLREAIDGLGWRREILESQRSELTDELADHRLQLSHLEDHIRRLEERWRNLEAEAKQLRSVQQNGMQDQATAADELARLRAQIAAATKELDDAREAAAGKPRSFAIIPYDGPNGTQRRPIYIECTARGIILQPEGVVLESQDFDGPLGPGNPLDAALRAIREDLVRRGELGTGKEPYPLLVVRPGGTMAYSVARAAMTSWQDAFGYELIDEEMQLEFPPANSARKRLIEEAVADARQRQAILAAAMPSQFRGAGGSGGAGGFVVASRSGGFERVGGQPGGGNGFSGMPGTRRGNGAFSGSGRTGQQRGTSGSHSGSATSARNRQNGTGANGGEPDFGAGASSRGNAGTGGSGTGNSGTGSSGMASDGSSQDRSSNSHASSPRRATGSDADASADGGPGFGQAGSGGPAGGPLGSGGTGGGSMMGSSSAASRGSNWALPQSSQSATGITRPIRVVCWPDRLIVMPDEGDPSQPRKIELTEDMSDQIDDFVSAVWEHTEGWGLAVLGGYWKPVLHVEVAPGGDARFAELRSLLQESGLDVMRKPW